VTKFWGAGSVLTMAFDLLVFSVVERAGANAEILWWV
jgi:hypothetical protein